MGWAVVGYGSDAIDEAAAWKADQGYLFPLLCDPPQDLAVKIGFTMDYKGTSIVNQANLIVGRDGVVGQVEAVDFRESKTKALEFCQKKRDTAAMQAEVAQSEQGSDANTCSCTVA